MRIWVLTLASLSGLRTQHCLKLCLDAVLLWLWHRLAVAPIQALAWQLPYAMGAAFKTKKKKKEEEEEEGSSVTCSNTVNNMDIMLSEISQPPKSKYCKILLT